MKNLTTVERKSDREVVVTRTVDAPARLVFEAWTKPELFKRWWVPKSMGMTLLLLRDGCAHRRQIPPRFRRRLDHGVLRQVPRGDAALAHRLDERRGRRERLRHHGHPEEKDGKTLLVMSELYPSKEALDDAIAAGSTGISSMPEQLEQLDALLLTLGASA